MEITHLSSTAFLLVLYLIFSESTSALSAAAATSNRSKPSLKLTVDASYSGGRGRYKRIQDAVDAVPANYRERVFIRIEPGVYREKVVVPANKPFLTLSGRKANVTIVTWNDGGDIHKSPTVTVFGSNFVGRYLTFQNTYGEGAQAVALRVTSDQAAFYGCRILSYQDTLLDESGNHYYKNCYIEGGTDFIFGNANTHFENCHIHSISRKNGAITAQKRESSTQNTGFYFVLCKITGIGSCMLGRPWGSYARVVFAYSYLSSSVSPEGWNDWDQPERQRTVYYGEYRCFGRGADRSKRVHWSYSITTQEALSFLTTDLINGVQNTAISQQGPRP